MAGGIFEIPNKVLPGLYYNVETLKKTTSSNGINGIVAMPLALKWGEGFIEITAEEMNNGDSFKKIGLKNTDPESKLILQALNYCDKVLVYNITTGGDKATATIGDITAKAKSAGTLGNSIVVSIVEDKLKRRTRNKVYSVITSVDTDVVDIQKISELSELNENDYITFEFDAESATLSANAGVTLTGGTDGTESTDFYTDFLKGLKREKWNVLAGIKANNTEKGNIVTFIKELRDNYGKNVQAVIYDYNDADYEGIIVTKQGITGKDFEITPEEFPVVVAGLTAGATMFISNTMKKIVGATKVVGEVDDKELVENIEQGFFMIGYNVDDEVVCSKDINSFISFVEGKGRDLSKNKILRIVYGVIQMVKREFELFYAGNMANTDANRQLYKSKLVIKLDELNGSAIDDFKPEDVTVEAGELSEDLFVEIAILPVDAVEKIYLRIKVR